MKIDPDIYELIDRLAHERKGEFDYQELTPAVASELQSKHGDALAAELARRIIAKRFRAQDGTGSAQERLFAVDAVVSLGNRRVIQRGQMEAAHATRRREVITKNYKGQFDAWRAEDDYLAERLEWLTQNEGRTIADYESEAEQRAA